MMNLRLLEPEDIPAVHELWREARLPVRPEGRDSPGSVAAEIEDGRTFYVGAFEGGRLVGVALGTDEGRKGWVNRLAVAPDHRRRGVAAALVAFCEREFLKRGRGLVCALVEEDNDASLALFRREGYVPRRDILYLRKALRGETW